jgi:hypothetical protein
MRRAKDLAMPTQFWSWTAMIAIGVAMCFPASTVAQSLSNRGRGSFTDPTQHPLKIDFGASPVVKEPESKGEKESEGVRQAHDKATEDLYKHQSWALEHRKAIYEWQFWSGIVVFVVALGIVAAGMAMAWMQFYVYYKQIMFQQAMRQALTSIQQTGAAAAVGVVGVASNQANAGSPSAGESERQSDREKEGIAASAELTQQLSQSLEISLTSVKITTPIIGVIILTLSLGFFYMFLHFVFPIQ